MSRRIVGIGLRTSLVVGTILNLINHDEILQHGWRASYLPTVLLNYIVPYLVATYGAVSATVKRK